VVAFQNNLGYNGLNMKLIAVTILIALVLTALSPLTTVRVSSGEQTVSFKTLDVCRQAGSMVLNNIEMPFVSERLCSEAPLYYANYLETSNTVNNLPLISIPIDLPPKV
jgi:hypothetical protein